MRFLLLLVFSLFNITLITAQETSIDTLNDSEKHREFDFWVGEWDVNLRQKQPDNTWKDWKKSKANIYKILDGRAILELWEEQSGMSPANTIIGYSLRYFDSEIQQWVLWLNWPGVNRSGSSSLMGEFRHGRGEFYSERPLNDSTSLISRYTFSDVSSTSLRWDDAFSKDGGATWTSNWIMEFSRTAQKLGLPRGNVLHTFRNGERCTNDKFDELERFVGSWSGTVETNSGEGSKEAIRIKNYKSLGNCSVMSFMEIGPEKDGSFKEFGLLTYNTFANKYEDGRLTNNYSSTYRALYGDFNADNQLQLSKVIREDGNLLETYVWTFDGPKKLTLEKWEYKGETKVKVLKASLSKE